MANKEAKKEVKSKKEPVHKSIKDKRKAKAAKKEANS